MGIASHYSEMNAQKGLLDYQSILLGLYQVAFLKERGEISEATDKLNFIKQGISNLNDVHVMDSVKVHCGEFLDMSFIEKLVQSIDGVLPVKSDDVEKEIIPILDKIQGIYPATRV